MIRLLLAAMMLLSAGISFSQHHDILDKAVIYKGDSVTAESSSSI